MKTIKIITALFITAFFAVYINAAKPVSAEDESLVKASNNPMANMISLPLQWNYDHGSGPGEDGNQVTLNVQPIIPIQLSDEFVLISRTIMPLKYLDNASWEQGTTFGMGDTVQSFFLGPKDSKVIWGVGPSFMLPTATTPKLSAAEDRWSAGPAAIIAYQEAGWTFAAISYQVWSFAGPKDNGDVNFLFFQPVIMKSLGLVSVGVNSEIQRDWENHQTIIPINFMASKLVRFGKMPVTIAVGLRWYAEKPEYYSKWGARAAFTFMLPESIFTGKK